jgi:hypothetical protein
MEGSTKFDAIMILQRHAPVSSRVILLGFLGGLIALLAYTTCELLVQGFMGAGFRLTPSEKVTTAILMVAIAALIHFIPSASQDIASIRQANEEELAEIAKKITSKPEQA